MQARMNITAALALAISLAFTPSMARAEEMMEFVTETMIQEADLGESSLGTDACAGDDEQGVVETRVDESAVISDDAGDDCVSEMAEPAALDEEAVADVSLEDMSLGTSERTDGVGEAATMAQAATEHVVVEVVEDSLSSQSDVTVSGAVPMLTSAAIETPIKKKGWNQDSDGVWYWSADGKNAAHGWRYLSGVWYYLDSTTGAMKCNETFIVSGKTYVATASGACPANRWVRAGGRWYLTDSSCACRVGWVKLRGTWYYLDTQTKTMKESETFVAGGKTYVAKASGACPSNAWVKVGSEWYLTDSSCACRSGWASSGGTWYYLNQETKAMLHDRTFVVSGKTYVARSSGACPARAWVLVGGSWYLTDGSCACRSGWVTSGGATYYLDPKTKAMKQNESFTVNGRSYLATSSGSISDGSWNKTAKGWYYTVGDGTLATGWKKIGGIWYYFDKTGLMKQGEVFTVDGKRYIARRDGSCPANAWVENGGAWYRTDSSCAVRTGWWSTGVTLYYFNSEGASLTGAQTVSGKRYFFYEPMGGLARSEYVTLKDGSRAYVNGDGIISDSGPTYGGSAKSGWSKYGGDWYYIDAETGKPTTGWITYKNKRYWLDPEGVMVTGSRLIDGKAYWFSTDGDLLKELEGTVDDLLKVAEADIGYDVNEDKATGSVYGRWYQEMCNPWKSSIDYGADDVAWCVMTVSYWCYQAGVGAPGIPHAGCETIADYARREGLVVAPEDVERGQLILYDWDEDGEPDHIGIVEKRVSDRKVKSVEGNTSDKVASRTRDIDSVYCGVKAYLV